MTWRPDQRIEFAAISARRLKAFGVDVEQSRAGKSILAALGFPLQNNPKECKRHSFWRIWDVRHFLPAFSFATSKERGFVAGSSRFRPQNRIGFVAGLRRIANPLLRAALCVATSAIGSFPEAETGARART